MTIRRTWILAEGSLEGILLGPMKRVQEIGRQALAAGTAPTLLLERQSSPSEYEGIPALPLTSDAMSRIRPGDAVIASAHLHPKHLAMLVRMGIPFHADLYNLAPYEHLEFADGNHHPFRVFQSRRRTARRYRLVIERAERVYLSNPQQLNFLGGMLFAKGDAATCRLASRLPEKCMFLPMGCSIVSPHDATRPNPYPEPLRMRPIFLWGGGIWSWFDIPTLIEAFRILDGRGSDAALFFLASGNPSSNKAHDEPLRFARESAMRHGLLERNIFFTTKQIGFSELPGYIAHCHAGIMANPPRLESYGSWRTRLLDLLPHGKPVVCSGYDPLSHELNLVGASLTTPAGDAEALSTAIEKSCRNETYTSLAKSALHCSESRSWNRIFAPWREILADIDSFSIPPRPLPLSELFSFVLGS